MHHPDRFRSELLSITAAAPSWRLRLERIERDDNTHQVTDRAVRTVQIAAWATVRCWYINAPGPVTEVEPVFTSGDGLSMTHLTAYRAMVSDVDPLPGEPHVTVAATVIEPK